MPRSTLVLLLGLSAIGLSGCIDTSSPEPASADLGQEAVVVDQPAAPIAASGLEQQQPVAPAPAMPLGGAPADAAADPVPGNPDSFPAVGYPLATLAPLPTQTPLPPPTEPPPPTPDPFLAAGNPVRLEIPAIGVDAFIEQVGLTPDRAMATPKGWMNAGWYMYGARPGEAGNAVIAGHFDSNTGGPAVFWRLSEMMPGDEVTVSYENGDRYTFMAQDQQEFEWYAQGHIIDSIFGASQTSDLNLITCQGAWDRVRATYTKRLVVFTQLIPERTVRTGLAGAYE